MKKVAKKGEVSVASKETNGGSDGFIDSLFGAANGNTSLDLKKFTNLKKRKVDSREVANVPEKRLTKKEKKLMESQS